MPNLPNEHDVSANGPHRKFIIGFYWLQPVSY